MTSASKGREGRKNRREGQWKRERGGEGKEKKGECEGRTIPALFSSTWSPGFVAPSGDTLC